jgi:predicted nucleic acid-binding Zn ribbon protein
MLGDGAERLVVVVVVVVVAAVAAVAVVSGRRPMRPARSRVEELDAMSTPCEPERCDQRSDALAHDCYSPLHADRLGKARAERRRLADGLGMSDASLMARRQPRRGIEPLGLVLSRDRSTKTMLAEPVAPIEPRIWELAVGTRIARRTRPLRIDRGVLHVIAASAAWAQELSLLSEPILAELRKRGHALTSLRFRVGPVEAPRAAVANAPRRRIPLAAPLDPALCRALERVADPELRAAIERAARIQLGFLGANRR